MKTVVLLDLDGTLVTTGGAGRSAMAVAARTVLGNEDPFAGFSFAGRTDLGILRHAFEASGQIFDDEGRMRFLSVYLPELEKSVAASEGYVVHDGAKALVETLAKDSDLALGLGTGNVEQAARIKLQRAQLNSFFAFGGFGGDHEKRAEMLRIGLERGATTLGVPSAECRCVVVGDTPRDVLAANALNADSIAVTTGPFGAAELREPGPTLVVDSLRDPRVVPILRGTGT